LSTFYENYTKTNPISILIAESDEMFLYKTTELIKNKFHDAIIHTANSLLEIKEKIQSGFEYTILLVDLNLRDSQGFELVETILAIQKNTALVVLSSFKDSDQRIKAYIQLGVADYLYKENIDQEILNKSLIYSIERNYFAKIIKESEDKYKNIFRNNPSPMYIYDVETLAFLDVNNAALEKYGYTYEEFRNLSIKDIRPKKEIPLLEKLLQFRPINTYNYKGVWKHLNKMGYELEVEVQSNPMILGNKKARIVTINDITEKLENALKLEKLYKRLNAAEEISNLGYWEIDLKTHELFWSDQVYNLFNISQKNSPLTLQTLENFIHPEEKNYFFTKLYESLNQAKPLELECKIITGNDSLKDIKVKGNMVFDQMNTPLRFEGIMQDITLVKQEQSWLKLLESVITNSNDSALIAEFCSEIDFPCKIIYHNQAFTELSQYDSNDLNDKNIQFLFGKETNKEQIFKLKEATIAKQKSNLELICYKKNGESFWANISVSPVFNSIGWVTHWVIILRDISEKKAKEKERETLIHELSHSNKDLKQFAYTTSHNLRSPLANLVSISKMIQEIEIENPLLEKLIHGFISSTNVLNDTVTDLSNIISLKDTSNIEIEDHYFSNVFDNILLQTQHLTEQYKPIIDSDFSKAPTVKFNRAYLESILLNLYTNAIKYSSPQRKLHLRIHTFKENGYITLEFEDNGVGIDLEKYGNKIFGLYQRFHNHPDSKGLGLYLVKSHVESLGGKIAIESEVEKGTKFIIHFKIEPDVEQYLAN